MIFLSYENDYQNNVLQSNNQFTFYQLATRTDKTAELSHLIEWLSLIRIISIYTLTPLTHTHMMQVKCDDNYRTSCTSRAGKPVASKRNIYTTRTGSNCRRKMHANQINKRQVIVQHQKPRLQCIQQQP